MCEIWANELFPQALKSCPKSNKSPNLVTLRPLLLLSLGHLTFGPMCKRQNVDVSLPSFHLISNDDRDIVDKFQFNGSRVFDREANFYFSHFFVQKSPRRERSKNQNGSEITSFCFLDLLIERTDEKEKRQRHQNKICFDEKISDKNVSVSRNGDAVEIVNSAIYYRPSFSKK